MKNYFAKLANLAMISILGASLVLAGCGYSLQKTGGQKLGYYPGTLTSLLPNYPYPIMNFTATSQTDTQPLSGVGWATVEIYGPATVATVTCTASNDGALAYTFGLPYSDGTITATYNTVKMIAAASWSYSGTPVGYYVNLSGMTNVKCVTSSTFTGASMQIQITASGNPGLL